MLSMIRTRLLFRGEVMLGNIMNEEHKYDDWNERYMQEYQTLRDWNRNI